MHSFLFQMDGLGWLLAVSGSESFLCKGNASAMDCESIVPRDGTEIKLDKLKKGLKELIHGGLSHIPAYGSPAQVQFSEVAPRPKGWYHTPERSEPNHGQDSQPAQPHAGGEGGLPGRRPRRLPALRRRRRSGRRRLCRGRGDPGQPAPRRPEGGGGPALAPHPQRRGGRLHRPRRPAGGGSADLLHRGLRPLGVGAPVCHAARPHEAPAPVPGSADAGPVAGSGPGPHPAGRPGAGGGHRGSGRLLRPAVPGPGGPIPPACAGIPPAPPTASSACTASQSWTSCCPGPTWWP